MPIVAQVEGGLGSQMVGYASARRLAIKLGTEVFIDARNYRTYDKFKLELHHFDVDATLLLDEQADELLGPNNERITVVEPKHLHVDSAVLEIEEPHVLMRGVFFSEDYWSDVADVIRRDFTRITEPSDYELSARRSLREIELGGYEPVAVHVRRGDYLDPHINKVHGLCTDEYYRNAMELMGALVPKPWFVFFSNDTEWIRETFVGENFTITSPTPDSAPVEDMMLMASCRHNIIANSTYSWWGAWLNDSINRRVICPRPLLADRTINTEDIPVRTWISLGSNPRQLESSS